MTSGPTAQRERCPQCHAPMSYDARVKALSCAHCGATKAVAVVASEETHAERPLHEALSRLEETAPRGYDLETRSARCQQCGATVAFPEGTIASHCDFCGGPIVLLPESSPKPLRPTGLVPFQVDQGTAQRQFQEWLRSLWFRPNDLRTLARVAKMQGVYVPYWTFDAAVVSDWTAESGTYYYETESYVENGQRRTRQVQKTRWSAASGRRWDTYDDFLVCASRGLERDLARKLATFDTKKLEPWDARFLLGWHAEEYAVGLSDAWGEALAALQASQKERCARDVPGDTHRNLLVRSDFSEETFKHVLLPLWIASYRYRDRVFQFLVNGQTGEVRGNAPWSWVKIALAVVAALVVLAVFAALQR